MPGVSLHPQPRVQGDKHTSRHHRCSRNIDIPCAMVLTLLRALPGVHDLLVTVACRIIICKLSASPGARGPHDLAVRNRIARLTTRSRPSHPASNTRDDREAPLLRERDKDYDKQNFAKTEEKFSLQLPFDPSGLKRLAKFGFSRGEGRALKGLSRGLRPPKSRTRSLVGQISCAVIPGQPARAEPGIHNHSSAWLIMIVGQRARL
jgi:hypothetical protein